VTKLHVDWRQAHRWWSTWALLAHALGGVLAAWGALEFTLPPFVYILGSVALSVAVWMLSHINQTSLEPDDDGLEA
jgi:hypothetical protein